MIKLLDQFTIDKIAAGEVIEKPGSVVKELVENSIDAGATAVTVEIKDGGLSFIRITDNGCGISKDQVPTAFLRHATSKLTDVDDLLSLASLGFRGEALSSIAAIAQVELITKERNAIVGTRYLINGGKEISNEEIGAPDGTTIIARNLFYNTPARKKYMKSAAAEGSYIYDLVCLIAMSHPEVSFKLIVNGTDKLFTTGNGKLKDIIYHIYGKDITTNVIEVNRETSYFTMTGYLGKPNISRGNRSFENYFVNSRYIKSSIITKAIEDAYRTFVMVHKFPFVVLNFEVNPAIIDVNIHPAKRELKFIDAPEIYDLVHDAVREALLFKELIPEVTPGKSAREVSLAKRDVGKNPEPFESVRRGAEVSASADVAANGDEGKVPSYVVTPANDFNGLQSGLSEDLKDEFGRDGFKSGLGDSEFVGLGRESGDDKNSGDSAFGIHNNVTVGSEVNLSDNLGLSSHNIVTGDSAGLADGSTKNSQGYKYDVAGEHGDVSNPNDFVNENIQDEYRDNVMNGIATNPSNHNAESPIFANTSHTNATSTFENITDETAATTKYQQLDLFEDRFISAEGRKEHRLIGQLFKTYWLIEYKDKFFIMDQHAAHEKVNFERLMENYKNKTIISQYLMPPAVVTLTAKEEQFLKENMETFEELGFAIESFGGKEYKLNAVPDNLFGLDGRELFIEFLSELSENERKTTIDIFIRKLSTMACKAAIKGNTAITFTEADVLIDDLLKLENPYTCPHGRPTIISMTETEIEKKFKRIV